MRPVRITMAFTVHIQQTSVSLAGSSVPRRTIIR
jgi:hypothetical protein